jgi:peptide methionine sulfoxide reductase msrA/msrB
MEQTIYLAGGCFWGLQAYFKQAKGVLSTRVGYCNGNTAFPKYEDLKHGKATHAETLKIVYDDTIIDLDKLLELFLRVVDPYSVNKQGEDEGLQYRSGVYYTNMLDGIVIDAYFTSHLKPGWKIEIKPMNNFFPAEEYHQDYLDKNPGGYCHINLNVLKPSEKK